MMNSNSKSNIFRKISHSLRVWLERMPENREVLILAFIVGLGSGFAAVLLMKSIHFVQSVLVGWFETSGSSYLYLVYPGAGMLLAYLIVRFVVRDDISHGVTKVLLAISRYDSKIKPHNIWSSLFTSAITIGFGGSVGAEAPIVYTGAAIGSNIGRKIGLSYKNITLILGCGAAGAIAGIFKAPMAGVLFTFEILLFNMSMTSILPLVLSSVTSTTVTYLLMGDAVAFHNTLSAFVLGDIPYYAVFGIICGFASLYFTRATLFTEDQIKSVSNPFIRWAFCAVGLGMMIFLFPPLYGEGYSNLTNLLNGNDMQAVGNSIFGSLFSYSWFIPVFFALVFFVKVFSMSFTNAGGGVGGTFGPTLFMGGIFGFVIARSSNLLGLEIPETNFVLVGMAGLMAGVMQAPLTAIFLIAEITGGYTLLMPLIITSAISYATIRIFEPYSIYTKRIAKQGFLLTHDSDKAALTLLKISDVLESNFAPIDKDATLGDLTKVIPQSKRDIYPVLEEDGRLAGTVWLNDVKADMFDPAKYATPILTYMEKHEICAFDDDRMEDVMHKFEQTGGWNLPVVDRNGKYKGFVSRAHIFFAYRERLHEVSHD